MKIVLLGLLLISGALFFAVAQAQDGVVPVVNDNFVGARDPVVYSIGRVDVVPVGLVRVAVLPPFSSLDVGTTMQFSALCEYTDGFIGDCRDPMLWNSMNPETIIIESTTGIATGISVGPATVTVSLVVSQ